MLKKYRFDQCRQVTRDRRRVLTDWKGADMNSTILISENGTGKDWSPRRHFLTILAALTSLWFQLTADRFLKNFWRANSWPRKGAFTGAIAIASDYSNGQSRNHLLAEVGDMSPILM